MYKGNPYKLTFVCFLIIMVCCFGIIAQASAQENGKDPLTEQERAWLSHHPVIRLAPDSSAPPLDIVNYSGKYDGLNADYIALMEERLGIKFQVVLYNTWKETLSAARARNVDVLTSTFMTPERQHFLLFSKSYFKPPIVIITRNNVKENLTMDKLPGRKVVVVSGYAWQELLKSQYPDINLITVNDPATGLKIISSGGADAMVNDFCTTSYYINEQRLTNLIVAGDTDFDGSMYFACRNDWPELQRILNKGLDLITPEEKKAIRDKWIHPGSNDSWFNQHLSMMAKTALGIVILAFLIFIIWSRRQIRLRNRELAGELAERKRIEEETREKNHELQSAYQELSASYEEIEALTGEVEDSYNTLIKKNYEITSINERLELALWGAGAGMWDWSVKTGELIYNERYAEIYGYDSDELPHQVDDWESRISPEDWADVKEKLCSHVEGRRPFYEAEYRIKHKNGEWVWIHDSGKIVSRDEKGRPERAVGIIREITARKETEFALKESEQRYREVFENTSDGMFLIDIKPDGRFYYTDFNLAEEKILGFPLNQYLNSTPEGVFSPEASAAFNANYRRCLETGELISYEQVLNLPAGRKYLHNTLIPVANTQGQIYRIVAISQDITEHKQNQEAAIMEERRLRCLVGISQRTFGTIEELLDYVLEEVVAFSGSRLGYINLYSEEKREFSFYTWTRATREECAIADPRRVYSLEEAGLWSEVVRQRKPVVINNYEEFNGFKKGYPPGHISLIRFMSVPIFSEGSIVAVIGVANKALEYTDLDVRETGWLIDSLWKIAEIKQAELALKKSEEKFSKAFYSNPVSMALISMNNRRFIDVNEVFGQRSGYRRAEIIGQAVSEIGEWLNRESLESIFEELEVRASVRGVELDHRTPEGKHMILRVAADMVDFDGQSCALAAVEDITEKRRAEQSLASSMALYQGIFNDTNNAIFLLDSDEYTILEANPAAHELFGYTPDELKHLQFVDLNAKEPQEAAGKIREDINKAWREGKSSRRGFGKKKTGELLPVWAYYHIIPINDQHRVLVVMNDLSEEIRFQEEHEKALKYEAQALKMTTISVVSAGVVHEISQPLNAIKVLADGMLYQQEMGYDIDIIYAFDAFDKISIQAERINDIIKHMRNLANSVNSPEDAICSPTDLNGAIRGALKILGRQLAAHGIRVELDLDEKLAPVMGQGQYLEEILLNLIANAMHALDEHKREINIIICRTRQEKEQGVLEIADNGPGISTALGSQIWDPFFSTRKGGQGMGLGLVIVQSIVARLAGTITYYNNEWGGATFRVELSSYLKDIPRQTPGQ